MIKTNIKTTNIELSSAISEYIDKKLSALHKFVDEDKELLARVEVGKVSQHHKSGDIFMAEVHISFDGQEFYAKVEKDDLYAAIDEVKDQIIGEIKSKKNKSEKLFRKGATKVKNFIKKIGWK